MGFDPKQVVDWLDKYKRGTISSKENELLISWRALSSHNEDLFQEIDQDELYFSRLQADIVSAIRVFSEVQQRMDDPAVQPSSISKSNASFPTRVVSFSRRIRWIAAASVLAIFTIGYCWVHFSANRANKSTPTGQPIAKSDILPGGNKAVLVLANGSKITLDSMANGVLAVQGNTQIHKLSSGQLAYTPIGHATDKVTYNSLSTPRGGQYQLTLPDGSKVWLNSESTLSYPVAFAGLERKVRLTGEAFFEVVTDPSRPFRVETANGSIQVLGTSFNISSYPDEEAEMTTLLTGAIKVNTAARSLLLKPGEQAFQAGATIVVKHPNLQTVTAWRRGFFNFSEADIVTVVRQLARWYDVQYRFEGEPTREKIDGLIGRDLTLSESLAVLRTLHINATLVDRTIVIKP